MRIVRLRAENAAVGITCNTPANARIPFPDGSTLAHAV